MAHVHVCRQAFTALKLCCWITSLELRAFTGPYEAKDAVAKFNYFLPRFAEVLADPDAQHAVWEDEYRQVRRMSWVGDEDVKVGSGSKVQCL